MTIATPAPETASMKIQSEWQPSMLPVLLGAGLGGLAAYAIIHQVHPLFPRPDLPELGPYPSNELLAQYRFAELEFHRRNGAVDCGILGGGLGLICAIAVAKRRLLSCVASSLAGALSGLGIGYAIGQLVGNAINQSTEQSIAQSTFLHAAVFAVIGTAVWGTLTLVNRPTRVLPALVFATLGGLLAAILYNAFSSIAFPLSNLSIITPVATSERVAWVLFCSVALFFSWALEASSSKRLARSAISANSADA